MTPGNTPTKPTPTGWVSFVGAGPGDPGLLTMRALELLQSAEVVITEMPEHVSMVRTVLGLPEPVEPREGEETIVAEPVGPVFIDGGFAEDGQPLAPANRSRLVVKHGKKSRVVRLMTGDPFMYASGPEEAQACVKAGIGFEIVPGVSAVAAVPAYAGIPLTDKNHREVAVVTCGGAIDWSQYADNRTLVLLSGVGSIGESAKALIEAGRSASTPVAVTRVGTTTEQSTLTSTLENVAADVRAARVAPPAIIVIGDVVNLRGALSWFETKPLFGWRVLVPRTKEQAGSLSSRLRDFGGVPEEVPTISVEPPRNPLQMDKAVRGLVEGRYEWIAFTSVNAVKAVREKFEEYGLDARSFSGLKIAAVGDKTAAAIAAWGLRADLVPTEEQSAAGLLAEWPPYDDVLDPINRVFLPRADIATEVLVSGLIELGWECDDVTAYRTVRAAPPPAPTRDAIKTGKFDAVVFTSSSTVRNLVGIAGKPHPSTIIAVIGPATAKTAEEHGLRVDVMAAKPDVDVLVDALADFGAARRVAMLEAGLPVTKPSDRKAAGRRKVAAK
ncbi:uroporphyrinogen-III synthase [Nocardioides gilvus]|uniref:uroporphyrinogen-III synthase n=1 Tax=Nocardioides gilvus TaxID=1735589 RepID=UPI000D74727E|nr:uroporphyrinogen-III synthase [Nocardioides gilvus]